MAGEKRRGWRRRKEYREGEKTEERKDRTREEKR